MSRHDRDGLSLMAGLLLLLVGGLYLLDDLTTARVQRVVSAWGIGAMHASLGDIDEAYRWLELAAQEKASGLILLRVHPRLDPIRSDARYWPLVRRVGLDDAVVDRRVS